MVLLKAMKMGFEGIASGLSYRFKRFMDIHQYPTFLVFQMTNNCNARCVMCNIWQKKSVGELSTADIKKALRSKLFKKLRWVNLTGGEPFLRKDIVEITEEFNRLPEMEGIAIPTNGFMTKIIVKKTEEMLKVLDKDKFLSITLSIDGFEKTHEEIRGVKGVFGKVNATLDELIKLKKKYPNFNVGVQPTISKKNLPEIKKFYKEMKKKIASIGFAVMLTSEGYYDNNDSSVALTKDDKKKIAKFLKETLKEDPQYGFYYSKLIKMFDTNVRDFGCLGGYITTFMDPFGNISPCPVLSCNKRYIFGNIKEDGGKIWFSKNAKKIKKNLKREKICCSCTMMCDFINMAKVEFIEHSSFLVQHPTILVRLLKKVSSEKNPYF